MAEPTAAARWAFANNRQSAYGTALDDVNITLSHTCTALDIVEKNPTKWKDDNVAFKGHWWVTETLPLLADLRMKRSFLGSSFILGYIPALVIGNVVTTQPDPTGSPTVYQHEIKPLRPDDPSFDLQLPVTSIVESYAGKKIKCRDLLGKGFEITGAKKEWWKINADLVGSGFSETSTLTMPDFMGVTLLGFASVQFDYDGTPIGAKIDNLKFSYQNNLLEDEGYHAGSGFIEIDGKKYQVRGRLLRNGDKGETFELSFDMLLDSAIDLENDAWKLAEKAITITAEGDKIDDFYNHKMELFYPKVELNTAKLGQKDGLFNYAVTPEIKFDPTLNAPFKIVITNNVSGYLAAP
jgi:hypothetical protein